MNQYFAFQYREPELVGEILSLQELKKYAGDDQILLRDLQRMEEMKQGQETSLAWNHARQAGQRISKLKDQRIIQIIDEFQYLNQYLYIDSNCEHKIELASSYQGTAESKISPQIITGSYVGWLTKIIQKMVSRYDEFYLESLAPEEALETVYNYASIHQVSITDQTAPYLAESCYNDPYYIAQVVRSHFPDKNLTAEEGVRETLKFETTVKKGGIARIWKEYLDDAIDKIKPQTRV